MSYGTDAKIPDDAKLDVKEIKNGTKAYKEYLKQACAAMGLNSDEEISAEQARFFDITITSGEKEVQPAADVNVSIREEDTSFVETNTESAQSVEFTTEGFSVYGIIYTVDFEYTDEEGTKLIWSWDGKDSYSVADIMAQLGVTDKITDASLKRTIDKGGPDNALYLEEREDGWYLVSEVAFDDTFELTVKTDIKTYIITVTDDSTNFRDSVREVTADGLDGDNWSVRPDVDYTIHLTFAESYGNVQFPNTNTLSYQLPEGFKPTGSLEGVEFTLDYTDGGVAHTLNGCSYDLDQNGNITIHLTPEAQNVISRAADAKIKVNVDGRFSNQSQVLDFGGGVKKTIDVHDDHKVTIEKNGDYKADDNKVHYRLTIKSEGENNNVKVTDEITGNALNLDPNSVVIKNSKGEVVPVPVIYNSNKFEFTIPKMNHNETYTVEYTASVNWDVIGDGKGTIDQTKNKATVKSDEDPEPDEKEINLQNKIDYNPIVKAHGEVPEGDSNTKTIPWTITINDSFIRNMKNAKITDRNGSPDVMKYSGDGITIDRFDQNGNKTTVEKTWQELNVDISSATTWTYTIPDDGKYKYVISYTTDVDVSKQNALIQVKNTVEDDKGHSGQGTADVEPGSSAIKVDKKFESAKIEDMSWSVTITVPATGLNKAIMTDTLPSKDYGGKKYKDLLDQDSISVDGLEEGESYVITPSDGKFIITFYKDKDHTEPGLKKTAETGTRDIKVTFNTLNDEDWVKDLHDDAHQNHVEFKGDNGVVTDQDQGTLPKKSLDKVFKESKEFYIGDVKLLAYKYAIDLYGVEDSDFKDGTLTITDEYPNKYLELWDLNVKTTAPDGQNGWWDQTIQNGNNSGNGLSGESAGSNKFVISASDGKLSFVFKNTGDRSTDKNVLPRNTDGTYFDRYQVTYYLVVKDAAAMKQMLEDSLSEEDRTIELKNTAKWGESVDDVIVDYGYEALTKTNVKPSTMDESSSGVYDPETGKTGFTIDINPGELTLNESQDMTLTDTFSDTLSVDYSSIKIYEITSSGERILRNDIQYDYKGNVGTYIIPDGKHFLITYDAKLVGKPGQNVHYENKVEMNGFRDNASGDKQISGSGEASANIYSVRLYKYESGHMEKPIPGTVFTMVDESGNPMTYPNYAGNAEKRGKQITFTTGNDGYAKIEFSQDDDGISLQKGVTYYLKETQPSAGYSVNNVTYRFTISDNPDYSNYEYHSGDILKVYDSPVKGQIEIEKTIIGAGNLTTEDKQKITFSITGTYPDGKTIKADEQGNPVEEADASEEMEDFNMQVSYADFTDGKFLMQDLVLGDYTVKETNAALDGYSTVTTTYKLDEVEQAGKDVKVTITDTNKHSVKVTNSYEEKKPGIDINIKKVNKNGAVITNLYGAKFKLEIFDESINGFVAVTEGSVAEDGTFSIPYENRDTGVTLSSLSDGKYRITEIQAPENYQIVGDGIFEFEVNGENVTYTDTDYASYTSADKTFTVNNESDHSYKFTKVDGTSVSIKLPGAEFGVFEHTTDAADKTVNDADAIKVYTTDSDGRFDIKLDDVYDSEGRTIYFVKEIKAPEGYKLPESPKLYYFYFGTATTEDGTGRLNAVNLRDRSGRETVTNDLNQIEVEKKWLKYSTGEEPDITDIDSVDFALYQTRIVSDASTGEEISREEKRYPDNTTTFTVTKNGHWKTTINDLPAFGAREGNNIISYTYRVEELNVGDGFEMTFKTENDGRKLVMENTPKSTWVKAEKKWIGVPSDKNKNVTLKLQRRPKDGSSDWTDVANMDKQLDGTNGWEATWDKLPETYYYRVREKSMSDQQNYMVVYSSNNGEEGTLGGEKVTITNIYNETQNGKIAVQKYWLDSNGNSLTDIPSDFELKGEIWQKVYKKDGYKVTVNYFSKNWQGIYEQNKQSDFYYVGTAGGSVALNISPYGSGGTAYFLNEEKEITPGGTLTVDVHENITINIYCSEQFQNVTISSVDITNEAPAIYQGEKKWKEFTLNGNPGWKVEYDAENIDDGYAEYYIKNVQESDDSYKLEYYNNDGIKTGNIIMTNTYTQETGKLNVKKNTTFNGASDRGGLLDGTYTFTIKGKEGTDVADFEKQITLTVEKGVTKDVEPKMVDDALNVTASAENGVVTISKLPTGKYTVTENLSVEQKDAGISLLGENNIELEVTKNNNSNIPTAEFVNNLAQTKAVIKGTKAVTGGGNNLSGYSFTLSSDDSTAPLPGNTTATSNNEGLFEFTEITYSSSILDAVSEVNGIKTKELTYKVTENLPQGSEPVTEEEKTAGYAIRDGVKYDISSKEVKVTVSLKIATGEMTATVTPDQSQLRVVNEQLKDFTFYKIWRGNEPNVVEDWKDDTSIKVTVSRMPGNNSYSYTVSKADFTDNWKEIASTTQGAPVLKVKLGSGNGNEKYTFYMDNLEKVNSDGVEYTYSVTEDGKVDGYQEPSYGYKSGEQIIIKTSNTEKYAGDKQYIVNTPENAVSLPSTGGPGTKLFYGIGIAFITMAGLLFFIKKKSIRSIADLSERRW